MKVFWILVFLYFFVYCFCTFSYFQGTISRYAEYLTPSLYSKDIKSTVTVAILPKNKGLILNDTNELISNEVYPYKPEVLSIDSGEKLRGLGLLCIPESFGYSVEKGKKVFEDYNYPKCSQKNKQNGTYVHIDRKANLMFMDCPNPINPKFISGPLDHKRFSLSEELYYKWKIQEYTKPIPADSIEFVLASCESDEYTQATMQPIFNQSAYNTAKSNLPSSLKKKPKLIYFLTLDSMSRRHAYRKIPKVIDFLNALNSNKSSEFSVFDFKIHNILGPDSISNQVPIFGGIENFVRNFKGKQDIDKLGKSALWSILREKGFVSLLGLENCDSYFPGSLGRVPEVDYSVGPFYCAVQKFTSTKFDKRFEKVQRCLGGHHTHYYILNYTKTVVELNKGVNLWLYNHLNAAHESSGQHAATLNDDITEYLQMFLQSYSKDFDIFIYLNADHGMRYGNWFKDTDAYQENKLPALFIIASKSLLSQYKFSYHALTENSKRLTSKLDLRETSLYLAGVNETTSNSYNLLTTIIPKSRECEDANISAWDCACINMELLENPSNTVNRVITSLVSYAQKIINSGSYSLPIYPLGMHCKKIELTKVLKIFHVSINNVNEFFKLEIESSSRAGMIFQVNYLLASDGKATRRLGYLNENIIVKHKVKVKVWSI